MGLRDWSCLLFLICWFGVGCGGQAAGKPTAQMPRSPGATESERGPAEARAADGQASDGQGVDRSSMPSKVQEASSQGAEENAEAPQGAQSAGQPLVLWRVLQDGRLVAYLHGSVHVLPGAHMGQEAHIDQAYADSDVLVVEVDIATSSAALAVLTTQLGMYPRGETLADHVDDDLLERVAQEAERYGVPKVAALRMRPWLLALTLTLVSMREEGFSQEYGVDLRFLEEAHGRGGDQKPVVSLESAEAQLRLYADLPEKQQLLFLRDVLVRAGDDNELRSILDAWAAGDIKRLEQLIFAPLRQQPDFAPLYETFYFRRNRDMATRLTELFQTPQVYFVVVGAAHLVGDQSIVALLKDRGLTVEQVYVEVEQDGRGAVTEPPTATNRTHGVPPQGKEAGLFPPGNVLSEGL